MGKPKKYYAVARGRNPGIFTTWFGPGGAEVQIRSYPGARYKGFPSIEEARKWMKNQTETAASAKKKQASRERPAGVSDAPGDTTGKILVYTDGGCLGNPGPGGYGAVILEGGKRTELARGFRLTTNNRMELLACIVALEALKAPSDVVLHSDSRYVVNGMSKGWAERWQARGWKLRNDQDVKNADLWRQLVALCQQHDVEFRWVRGHSGNPDNERCDQLAMAAARGRELATDVTYEAAR